MSTKCSMYHEESTTCEKCGIETDKYGNNELEPFAYCSYPDCGCDGARLCQATEGASDFSLKTNTEGRVNIACIVKPAICEDCEEG